MSRLFSVTPVGQITVPVNATSGPTTKIFATPGFQKAEKLAVLVCGSGAVRYATTPVFT